MSLLWYFPSRVHWLWIVTLLIEIINLASFFSLHMTCVSIRLSTSCHMDNDPTFNQLTCVVTILAQILYQLGFHLGFIWMFIHSSCKKLIQIFSSNMSSKFFNIFHPCFIKKIHPYIISYFHPYIISYFHPYFICNFHPWFMSSLVMARGEKGWTEVHCSFS